MKDALKPTSKKKQEKSAVEVVILHVIIDSVLFFDDSVPWSVALDFARSKPL